MKIVSWNVNGIRAASQKGLLEFVESYEPTILCLQETKAHREQVDWDLQTLGYQQSVWSSAQKKGYSGVATFSDQKPVQVAAGFGFPEYESEGRVILSDYEQFLLYNIYFPNGGSGPERHDFKQVFLRRLNEHLKGQLKTGRKIVVLGDYNVAHKEIDVYDPKRLSTVSGFLPEERKWMSSFLELGFVDTFRMLHPDQRDQYSRWSYREMARPRNNGWRIDMICVSENLTPYVQSADILQEVLGSDHCPVTIELKSF